MNIAKNKLNFCSIVALSLTLAFAGVGQTPTDAEKLTQTDAIYNEAKKLANEETAEAKRRSLPKFEQARKLYGELGNKQSEARCFGWLGAVYEELGEKERALEFYLQALPLFKAVGDKEGEATALSYIGSVYEDFGETEKALEFYEQTLLCLKAVGDKGKYALTLSNIGLIYSGLGEKQKAIEFYHQAIPLLKEADYKYVEAAALTNLGMIYNDLGEKQKALELFNQALALWKEFDDWDRDKDTLLIIGGVYSALGEKKKALELLNQVLPYFKVSGDKDREASTLSLLSSIYDEMGDSQRSLQFDQQALPLLRALGDRDQEAGMLKDMMFTWQSLGNARMAVFYGKQAVNIYQEFRQNIKGLAETTQKNFLKTLEPTYRTLADLLIAQGSFAQAEKVLAMLKEEEYSDFVRRDAVEIAKLDERVPLNEKEKALIARYSQLAEKITEIGQEFNQLDDKKRRLSRDDLKLSAEEQARYAELETRLNDANAAFQVFLTKELLAEIGEQKKSEIEIDRNLQAKLRKWGAGTVALYTVAGADRYRVILTTPTVQIDGKTELKIADLNKKIFEFRAALQNPNIDPRSLGKELYDILIKPVEKELKQANAKTLVWSLDGTLRYIPLAALSPDGKRYLVEDYQNVNITPKTRDDLTNSDADWGVLGLGVSEPQTVADPDDKTRNIPFSGLPGTQSELLAIVKDEKLPGEKGVLSGRRLMNKEFTVTNFKDMLTKETADGKRKYNLIHIASHFRLGSNWSNSFLLLGNGEMLTLEDINNSSTINFGEVELITLSACNTGFADDSNGKEIDSLASVIQNKSGKAVLATLWAVGDESTSLLMSEFYRLRKENPKLTKSENLQFAQKSMIEGKLKPIGNSSGCRSDVVNLDGRQTTYICNPNALFSHPFYWSPFVLYGNWR